MQLSRMEFLLVRALRKTTNMGGSRHRVTRIIKKARFICKSTDSDSEPVSLVTVLRPRLAHGPTRSTVTVS